MSTQDFYLFFWFIQINPALFLFVPNNLQENHNQRLGVQNKAVKPKKPPKPHNFCFLKANLGISIILKSFTHICLLVKTTFTCHPGKHFEQIKMYKGFCDLAALLICSCHLEGELHSFLFPSASETSLHQSKNKLIYSVNSLNTVFTGRLKETFMQQFIFFREFNCEPRVTPNK